MRPLLLLASLGLGLVAFACYPSGQALSRRDDGGQDADLDRAVDADEDRFEPADGDGEVDAEEDRDVPVEADPDGDGELLCSPASCDGCCRGSRCLPGDEASACGSDGAVCVECPIAEMCFLGICLICSAASCPDGCCLGLCLPNAWPACGVEGALCEPCDQTANECNGDGECACNGDAPCSAGELCTPIGCL